jgi:hypothetical protein
MTVDTDRLVQLAIELKNIDQRREGLLAELGRIAHSIGGTLPVVVRRAPGRPPGQAKPAAAPAKGIGGSGSIALRRGRPALSWQPAKLVPAVAYGRKQRKGLTTDIVEFLKSSGGAHTAGEIVAALNLPKTKSGVSTVSTTLVRLAKEGRAKKDRERGYRAA